MKDKVIYKLSKSFALRVIKLYKYLYNDKREFVMSMQIYRSGTSIGANIAESIYAQSDADYINKLKISLKEASETKYWLELLIETEYVSQNQYNSLIDDLSKIIGTLVNIVNTTKNKN